MAKSESTLGYAAGVALLLNVTLIECQPMTALEAIAVIHLA